MIRWKSYQMASIPSFKSGVGLDVFCITLISALILSLSGCSGKVETTPFFDGFYLTYHQRLGLPPKTIEQEITYRFTKLRDGNYEIAINQASGFGGKLRDSQLALPFPKHLEFKILIDPSGNILKGVDRYLEGTKIDLYLSEDRRRKGATAFGFWQVLEEGRWEKWKVWKLKPLTLPIVRYYDDTTGFLVGEEDTTSKKKRLVLVDTNLDLLLQDNEKGVLKGEED
jgi:hypothetical protein